MPEAPPPQLRDVWVCVGVGGGGGGVACDQDMRKAEGQRGLIARANLDRTDGDVGQCWVMLGRAESNVLTKGCIAALKLNAGQKVGPNVAARVKSVFF